MPPCFAAPVSLGNRQRLSFHRSCSSRLPSLYSLPTRYCHAPFTCVANIDPPPPVVNNVDLVGDGCAMNDDDDTETLLLCDPQTNRELNVGIEGTVLIDNVQHYVVHPIQDSISIALLRSDDQLQLLDDTELSAPLLSNAKAALVEQNMELVESAYVLTVDDDRVLDEELLCDDDDEDEDEADGMSHGFDQNEDSVELLAQFDFDARSFAIVRSVSTPTVLIARRYQRTGQFHAIQGDELAKLTPAIEEQMLEWHATDDLP